MADPFAPVQPNQPVVFSATAWNAMLAAGRAFRANQTGTANAYRPAGSMLASGQRPAATGDYQAWTPGQ